MEVPWDVARQAVWALGVRRVQAHWLLTMMVRFLNTLDKLIISFTVTFNEQRKLYLYLKP